MVWSNNSDNRLVFPPGAITGARMVIDQNGIVVYGSDNQPILQILAQPTRGTLYLPYDAVAGGTPGDIVYSGNPGVFPQDFLMVLDNLAGSGFFQTNDLTLFAEDGLGHVFQAWLADKFGQVTIPNLVVAPANSNHQTGLQINSGSQLKYGGGFSAKNLYYEYSSSVQALPSGVATTIIPPALWIAYDDYGLGSYNPATGIFTAPANSVWHLSSRWRCSAAAAAANQGITLGLYNATQFVRHPFQFALGAEVGDDVSIDLYMNAGDTWTWQAVQTSGGALAFDGTHACTVTVRRVI